MKKFEIGLPCTPAKHIEREKRELKQVLVSYGGGMGGSNVTYYCTDIKKGTPFYHLIIINKEGNEEEIQVNPTFIVEIRDIKVVKSIVDITAHKNYHGDKYPTTYAVRYIRMPQGDVDVVTTDKYDHDIKSIISYDVIFD